MFGSAAPLLGFAALSLAVALSPGPSWVYVIAATAREGSRGGRAAILGNATGIVCHVLAVAFGVAALLEISAWGFRILAWAGAAYLIWLGLRALLSQSGSSRDTVLVSGPQDASCGHRTSRRIWREGLWMALLNPKISLLMLALLPQFVDPARAALPQTFVLGAIHVAIASTTLLVVSTVVERVGAGMKRSTWVRAALRWAAGSLLIAFGVRLALAQRP